MKEQNSVKLIGSLTIGEKTYSLEDSRGFVSPKKFGLEDNFYGGRISNVAKTDTEGLFILLEGMTPIDILIIGDVSATRKNANKKQIEIKD